MGIDSKCPFYDENKRFGRRGQIYRTPDPNTLRPAEIWRRRSLRKIFWKQNDQNYYSEIFKIFRSNWSNFLLTFSQKTRWSSFPFCVKSSYFISDDDQRLNWLYILGLTKYETIKWYPLHQNFLKLLPEIEFRDFPKDNEEVEIDFQEKHS